MFHYHAKAFGTVNGMSLTFKTYQTRMAKINLTKIVICASIAMHSLTFASESYVDRWLRHIAQYHMHRDLQENKNQSVSISN